MTTATSLSNGSGTSSAVLELKLPPCVDCVFEEMLGRQGSIPLEGTGQPIDGAARFSFTVTRTSDALRVLMPAERDLRDEVLWMFPFGKQIPVLQDWFDRQTFEGTIGAISLMGEIVAVDGHFALLVVHQLTCQGEDLPLPDDHVVVAMRLDLTRSLSAVQSQGH